MSAVQDPLSPAARFEALLDLVAEEFPQISRDALEATRGDLDAMVSLLAERTDHTRVYLRRQLQELDKLAEAKGIPRSTAELEALVSRLETRARALAEELDRDLLPGIERRTRENPLTSLLSALGLGLLLGLILGGLWRGRR